MVEIEEWKEIQQGVEMNNIDELIEKAKERNAETEQQLRTIEQEQEERIKQERESRERLSKAIGEKFPDKKGKVFLEMEKDLEDKWDAEMKAKRQKIAESLGMNLDEFEQYLKLRGENQ